MTTTMQFVTPVENWFQGDYARIPERMQAAIKRYVLDRIQPGQFLTAVITNDLRGAVDRADSENAELLGLYVRWFHNVPPACCAGSPANMAEWLNPV